MKKINQLIVILLVAGLALSLTGCLPTKTGQDHDWTKEELQAKEGEIKILEQKIADLEEEISTLNRPEAANTSILAAAASVMELLEAQDLAGLADYVHPEKGVRFSPYFYTDLTDDQLFMKENVPGLFEDEQIYYWGAYDGSGEPIELNFSDYYALFIYDEDFLQAEMIGNNVPIGQGNTYDNIFEAYPEARFTEFHFPGFDPEFAGIDWRSLRLIFESLEGHFYLVGITHGQWTI